MLKDIVNNSADKIEKYKKSFIEDIKYIYNFNDLEKLTNLSPAQRLHILRGSKKTSNALKLYNSKNLKLQFNNYGNFSNFSITNEEDAQEIAKSVDKDLLSPYCFTCTNVIQSFLLNY